MTAHHFNEAQHPKAHLGATVSVTVVDDDPLCVELVRLYLCDGSDSGFSVNGITESATAVRAILSNPVDVVLLDLDMGEVDGLQVLRALRASGYAEPVVILTGSVNLPLANEL